MDSWDFALTQALSKLRLDGRLIEVIKMTYLEYEYIIFFKQSPRCLSNQHVVIANGTRDFGTVWGLVVLRAFCWPPTQQRVVSLCGSIRKFYIGDPGSEQRPLLLD